jgi:hypothetical protein
MEEVDKLIRNECDALDAAMAYSSKYVCIMRDDAGTATLCICRPRLDKALNRMAMVGCVQSREAADAHPVQALRLSTAVSGKD